MQQISTAVEQLNGVTQQVAANAEESASASEELAGQAMMLTDLVGTFQLEGGVPARGIKVKPAHRARHAAPIPYATRS